MQAGIFGEQFSKLGHDVAFSAFWGIQAGVTSYKGMPVYPGGREDWGMDVIQGYYRHWNADLLLTIHDVWPINTEVIVGSGMKVACWTPIDCDPIGAADEAVLRRTHALPIAMSRHGERMLKDAFFKPKYAPHGIDTNVFSPPADRDALRKEMGLEGKFVVGINAANRDVNHRKSFPEQFAAFARFQRKHKDAILLVHTVSENSRFGGLDLETLRDMLGLQESIVFANQYDYLAKLVGNEAMASWYGALDVLMNCARGEGFGLPIVEAQACGTPVIVTRASSMTELCGTGWKVGGQDVYMPFLHSWWKTPNVIEITEALGYAYNDAARRREEAREFALAYDAKTVLEKHWAPILEFLEKR